MSAERRPFSWVERRAGGPHPSSREESGARRSGGGIPHGPARKFERYDTRLRCWCEGEGVTYYGRMANVGMGGLFVRTGAPLSVGARAVVRFAPRGGAEVNARAHVVWTRPDGMGLRFDALDDRALEVIRGIVDNEVR